MAIRLVLIQVECDNTYCSNDCQGMLIERRLSSGYRAECTLFKENLEWDKRKKTNGYKRLRSCKLAEQHER